MSDDDNFLLIEDDVNIKLVPLEFSCKSIIDEDTYKSSKDYAYILNDVIELKEIMEEFSDYVRIQKDDIDNIDENIYEIKIFAQSAERDIIESEGLQSKYSKYAKGIICLPILASAIAIAILKIIR
jgi:hypothetical protein